MSPRLRLALRRLLTSTICGCALLAATPSQGGPAGPLTRVDAPTVRERSAPANLYTNIGNLGLSITDQGWFGNLLSQTRIGIVPSCEYPLNSRVEHLFVAGIWVGGIDVEGARRVSAGAEDTGSGSGSPKLEFAAGADDVYEQLSRNPLSPFFKTSALADQQFHLSYNDLNAAGGGSTEDPHVALGVRVTVDVLAYSSSFADDFVILLFEVENVGSRLITDLYVGWYNEMTVGNLDVTTPGSPTNGWNFYDDVNGYLGPEPEAQEALDENLDPSVLVEDPDARVMYSYDDDGEDGRAESWIGVRLLGSDAPDSAKFTYRQWRFGDAVARYDEDKYALMSSGRIDVGEGEGQGTTNFKAVGNWVSGMFVGPWPIFLPGDKVHFSIAVVGGPDGNSMFRNSRIAQFTYDNGFELPAGPPSPVVEAIPQNNQVTLRWKPGEAPCDTCAYVPELASPEYHRSLLTNQRDFQGYRIYRIQGDRITGDPIEQASLLAEFDITDLEDGSPDPIGFNRGLPPLDEEGYRYFVDRDVLNGFPYYYAVTSFAARDPRVDLPELESGFNVNAQLVIPGTAPADVVERETGERPKVGVYPNPYRAASEFDNRFNTGEPRELGRSIWFTNVPSRAQIDIYNVSGTRVDRLVRDDDSTGQVEWDLLSEHTRAIAPGLYIYAVEDLDTGEIQRGKLVILK